MFRHPNGLSLYTKPERGPPEQTTTKVAILTSSQAQPFNTDTDETTDMHRRKLGGIYTENVSRQLAEGHE